jgi:hypothetical protein
MVAVAVVNDVLSCQGLATMLEFQLGVGDELGFYEGSKFASKMLRSITAREALMLLMQCCT